MIEVSPDKRLTLKEVNRHPWVVAGGKGEMDLEDPMMDVVQTHIIPSNDTIDADVFQVSAGERQFDIHQKSLIERTDSE